MPRAREKRPSWFKMFRHQKALIDSVSDAEVGRAMKAVFQYFENGETPDMTPIEFAVFSSMKPYVDESFSDFARNSKKNAENINKRWEKQRDTSGTSGIQSLPLVPHDTTDTEAEAEAEEKPLRVFPSGGDLKNGDAAFKGGPPTPFPIDPDTGEYIDREGNA